MRATLADVMRDEPDCARAWSEGTALPLDVAVRYALDLDMRRVHHRTPPRPTPA